MRKIVVLLILIITITATSCNKINNIENAQTIPTENKLDENLWDTTVSFANWSDNDIIISKSLNSEKIIAEPFNHLPIFKIDTEEDLVQFKNDFTDIFSMDIGYDEIPSFEKSISKYNKDFFENNTLLIVYIQTSSGSLRFGLDSVDFNNDSVCVYVKQTNNPLMGTDDMSGWFITVAIEDEIIKNCKSFDANTTLNIL